MLEQKQIEEMSEDIARMLCEIYRPNCDEYEPHSCSECYVNSTPIGCFVEMLYNAGYRKQSEGEWIRHKENCLYNKCSVCEYEHCRENNYCPHCGALMTKGETNNE